MKPSRTLSLLLDEPVTPEQKPQERATEYRELANELFAEADVEMDSEVREQLIRMANACVAVAVRLEALAGELSPKAN
jgi:hypothetical protein